MRVESIENIYRRQLSIYNPEENQIPITIIGAGSIGSIAAMPLSKMGIEEMTVYDDDTIETHNFSNQGYPKTAVGNSKVNALNNIINSWTYTKIHAINRKWDGEELSGIVISGVDSLEERRKIWSKCRFKPKVKLFIDGRIGGQQISVYSINPIDHDQVEYYDDTLTRPASSLPCTERGVIDVSYFMAGTIVRNVREFLVNGKPLAKMMGFDVVNMEIVKIE